MAKGEWRNFFENIRFIERPKERKPETIFVCREVNRDTGKIRIYPIGWTGDPYCTSKYSFSGLHRRAPNKRCYAIRDSDYFENRAKIEELLCGEEIPDRETLLDYHIEDLG